VLTNHIAGEMHALRETEIMRPIPQMLRSP